MYYLFTVGIAFIVMFILTFFLQKEANKYRRKRRDINIALIRKFVQILMSKFEVLQNNKSRIE
jgi:hypothetical protein